MPEHIHCKPSKALVRTHNYRIASPVLNFVNQVFVVATNVKTQERRFIDSILQTLDCEFISFFLFFLSIVALLTTCVLPQGGVQAGCHKVIVTDTRICKQPACQED
jgi:hypothetical protein